MKKSICLLLIVFLIGCTNKKEQSSSMKESESRNDDRVRISQNNLDDVGLSKPASLREISDRLTDENRIKVTSINIENGESINTLNGIELFPALEYLSIHNSKIKNFNNIKSKYLNIKSLLIESDEMEDISNIVFFENLRSLNLIGFEKLKSFPDITHLKKLRSLDFYKCKGIDFNNLAEKLPLGIQMIILNNCYIKSFNDIASLFTINVKQFDLQRNLIKEIDFDMDYGAATYIYMTGCPIADKYFNWNEPDPEKYPRYVRNAKGVLFDFGPFQDEGWVIEE
jgi:hypothetical protein